MFLISYRNSIQGLAHLLSKVQVAHILVSPDFATQKSAHEALEELQREGKDLPGISSMPTYGDVYLGDVPFVPLPPRNYDYSATSVVIHSSGESYCQVYRRPICQTCIRHIFLPEADHLECSYFPAICRGTTYVKVGYVRTTLLMFSFIRSWRPRHVWTGNWLPVNRNVSRYWRNFSFLGR
jgi:hypothetical protein